MGIHWPVEYKYMIARWLIFEELTFKTWPPIILLDSFIPHLQTIKICMNALFSSSSQLCSPDSTQQSATWIADGLKSLQLSFPHFKELEHSASESQSPWPIEHGEDTEQKLQSELVPVPAEVLSAQKQMMSASQLKETNFITHTTISWKICIWMKISAVVSPTNKRSWTLWIRITISLAKGTNIVSAIWPVGEWTSSSRSSW